MNFLNNIRKNTKRYVSLFSDAADRLMPERNTPMTVEEVNNFYIIKIHTNFRKCKILMKLLHNNVYKICQI